MKLAFTDVAEGINQVDEFKQLMKCAYVYTGIVGRVYQLFESQKDFAS